MKKKVIALILGLLLITGCGAEDNVMKNVTTKSTTTTTTTTTTEPTTTTESTTTKKSTTTTKKTTTTTKSTNSTTKKTTTTTTAQVVNKTYNKVAEIKGTKVDKGKTSKGFSIYEIDGITYVDGYLIANKTYFLPKDYYPLDTYKSAKGKTQTCNDCINNTVWKAWQDMKAAAKADGYKLWIQSGYRAYVVQQSLYNRYVNRDGQAKADTYSARPGSSEHQTALCFDINNPSSSFDNTKEAKWIDKNAYKYGFIVRYPKGKMDITGYKYESWHVRYVGTELAKKLYNNGDWITMEEYFGITSKYQ